MRFVESHEQKEPVPTFLFWVQEFAKFLCRITRCPYIRVTTTFSQYQSQNPCRRIYILRVDKGCLTSESMEMRLEGTDLY